MVTILTNPTINREVPAVNNIIRQHYPCTHWLFAKKLWREAKIRLLPAMLENRRSYYVYSGLWCLELLGIACVTKGATTISITVAGSATVARLRFRSKYLAPVSILRTCRFRCTCPFLSFHLVWQDPRLLREKEFDLILSRR